MSSDSSRDSSQNAIVPHAGTEIAETTRRISPVIQRMTRDVLARAESRGLGSARFRIGGYLLREPDYRQIHDWANSFGELGPLPEDVLDKLAASCLQQMWGDPEEDVITFAVEDGAIRSLVLDVWYHRHDSWQEGMLIRSLGLVGKWSEPPGLLMPCLPQLQILDCAGIGLTKLDLSQTPRLTKLDCSDNQLSELDLSPVPELTVLYCSMNRFTALDLSPVPELTKLVCFSCLSNHTPTLDLSPIPRLTSLYCFANFLTTIDLSPVPGLTKLWCSENQLTALDLSPVPGLTELGCDENQLTAIDLSPVPGLTELECDKSVRINNAPANLRVTRR
jgi:hypothetical protein